MILNNAPKIVILTAVTAIAVTALSFLLITYTRSTLSLSLTQSIISQFTLFCASATLFFYFKYIKSIQAKAILHFSAIFLSTLLPYLIANTLFPKLKETLIDVIYLNTPLIFIFNILIWTIYSLLFISLDYKYQISNLDSEDKVERETNDQKKHSQITTENNSNQKTNKIVNQADIIKKISIKDGVQIHIIDVDDILFIQANGDYVDIHSESGKYIKEHTMKDLESSLPDNFIRIHRSYIVNIYKISRAELFGKESYNIYLKKGACIRASASGYKQLKNKLSI
jgi:hypothetical protein